MAELSLWLSSSDPSVKYSVFAGENPLLRLIISQNRQRNNPSAENFYNIFKRVSIYYLFAFIFR